MHFVALTHETSWRWLSIGPLFGLGTIRHAADALTDPPESGAAALARSEPGAAPAPTEADSVAATSRGAVAGPEDAPDGADRTGRQCEEGEERDGEQDPASHDGQATKAATWRTGRFGQTAPDRPVGHRIRPRSGVD